MKIFFEFIEYSCNYCDQELEIICVYILVYAIIVNLLRETEHKVHYQSMRKAIYIALNVLHSLSVSGVK